MFANIYKSEIDREYGETVVGTFIPPLSSMLKSAADTLFLKEALVFGSN